MEQNRKDYIVIRRPANNLVSAARRARYLNTKTNYY